MERLINIFFSRNNTFIVVLLFVFLELINVILMKSSANLLLTIPETIWVLYLLMCRGDVQNALLFHIIFCLTGFDATSASTEMQLMSYPKVKLVGPITLSYVILGLIWIRAIKRPITKEAKKTLIYQFRGVIIKLMTYGVTVGLFGILFFKYRFDDFILPFVYIVTGFVLLDILIRLLSEEYLKRCYDCMISLLIAAPIVAFLAYFFLSIRATYSDYDALIFSEVFILAPTLLIALFFNGTHRYLIIFSLILYFICVGSAGRGGFFFNITASFMVVIYLIYFSDTIRKMPLSKIGRVVVPIVLISIITYISTMDFGLNLGTRKIAELVSMFEAVGTLSASGIDISGISASPYIRIAEFLNIIENGLHNLLGLFFGYGYGGYYTDSTHLFQNVDVSDGGFPMEVINTGRYGTAHSFLPTTLLHNGVIGLFLICRQGIRYLKKVKYTPLVFAAFTLFFYSFYFNTSLFMAATFSLFAAESKLILHYDSN